MFNSKPSARYSLDLNRSVDGFLDNSFYVVQPQKSAHRSGMDAVLLAATVPANLCGHVADLGAGCGAAGMAVAQRCPQTTVSLIENNANAYANAREGLALAQNAHIAPRLTLIEADVGLKGEARVQAGLEAGAYDAIIANPPYNDAGHQISPSEDRAAAHAMEPDLLEKWTKTAAHMAKHKARFTMIVRPESLQAVLQALGTRFGSVRIKPIHPTRKASAILMLVQSVRGGRAPLCILPPLHLRQMPQPDDDNSTNMHAFSDELEAILRGRSGIDMEV